MGLERAALARVERALRKTPNDIAGQALAEEKVFREAVPCREERLLDLRHRQRELGRDLAHLQAVHLAQEPRLPLAVRQTGERLEKCPTRPGLRLGSAL